ncbi:MAG: glycosyltransferase family 4 protein [Maribacter sp.]
MKKVLVITYYWPPAGGPGVQRWLKFVKYFRDFGIEPVVYIPENPHYPMSDESFINDIPSDIKIYQLPIFEPYQLAGIFSKKKTKRISSGIIQSKNQSFLEKLLLWVRGNFFIPDARKYWVKPSVRFLEKVLKEEQIDTIITTGPPHSVHLIGEQLKNKHTIQWIADFRDPWTSIGYHKKLKLTSASKKKHKELESMVLNRADKIVVTSNTTKIEFEQLTNTPIKVITNGFDGEGKQQGALDAEFTISHIGSMLSGRNPINLWKVLAELVRENKDFAKSLKLRFIGVVSEEVLASLKDFGLFDFYEHIGYVSHNEALRFQQRSQILLLAEIDSEETKGIIPGKLFEYMAAQRPILGIGPKDWEVAAIVKQTNTGVVFNHRTTFQLKDVLLKWFASYQLEQLVVESRTINQYSRKELTGTLAEFILWESS